MYLFVKLFSNGKNFLYLIISILFSYSLRNIILQLYHDATRYINITEIFIDLYVLYILFNVYQLLILFLFCYILK